VEDEPAPIGPDIETILDKVLPEHVAQARVRLLAQHADAVLEIRDRHRRAWEEMVGREVRLMVFDGIPPRAAEQAARNNLGVRSRELDDELSAELTRLQEQLSRRLRRLAEDAGDERADQREGETPAT
jgi:hypothetical protein